MDFRCEVPAQNATEAEVDEILRDSRVIAVVGLSPRPERDSFHVSLYMKNQGYRIIPINPNYPSALGERSYASLRDIGEPVDLVNVFRRSEAVSEVVEDAIAIGAKAVWMQEGVVHNAAADRARRAGLRVVMNQCLLKEHRRRHI